MPESSKLSIKTCGAGSRLARLHWFGTFCNNSIVRFAYGILNLCLVSGVNIAHVACFSISFVDALSFGFELYNHF